MFHGKLAPLAHVLVGDARRVLCCDGSFLVERIVKAIHGMLLQCLIRTRPQLSRLNARELLASTLLRKSGRDPGMPVCRKTQRQVCCQELPRVSISATWAGSARMRWRAGYRQSRAAIPDGSDGLGEPFSQQSPIRSVNSTMTNTFCRLHRRVSSRIAI